MVIRHNAFLRRTPRIRCRAGCVDIERRKAVMPARSTASVRSAMSRPESTPDSFVFPRSGPWRSSRCRVASCRRTTDFKTAQPLLVLLLPLPFEVDLLGLAPDFHPGLALDLVPIDLQ